MAEEAAEKKKIFGWQNDHMKVHMMSVRQLMTLPRFTPPARVTTPQAAQALINERMVLVMQFPERLYELKDQFKPFEPILRITQEHPVNLPVPPVEVRPVNDYYHNYTVPTIEPLKPAFKEPEVVYETWDQTPSQLNQQSQQSQQSQLS